MTKHKEFIGLLMTPDTDKYKHELVRAAYRVVTNEDWDHPTIELGEATYMKDNEKDPMFPIAFSSAAPGYIALRDLCFKKDGYDAG